MKVPVIKRRDYTVYLEQLRGYTFIHCDCWCWGKTVKQNLTKDFDSLLKLHNGPIYAFHEIGDDKHLKFLNMFKFQYKQNIVGLDSVERQLFERIV